MTKASTILGCAAILGSLALGCHSEPKESGSANSEQPQPSDSAKTPDRLARALASTMQPEKAAPQEGNSAPPPDGVLDATKADSLAAAHSPPKLDLGSTGSEPRVKLVHRAFTAPLRASLQISVDLGNGQGIPPVDFKLELKPVSTAAGAGIQNVSARVVSAEMSMPNLPEELKGQLRKLKGSKFTVKVAENGGAFDCLQDAASNKNPELGELLDMVAQGLLDAHLALPSESVGSGAYWMTTSRQHLFGMDWITYDMVKLNEVSASGVKLNISTRRYVVGRDMPAPAQGGDQPIKLTIREAMATGNAEAVAPAAGNLLSRYERSSSVRVLLDSADNSGQRVLQTGGQAKFGIER